MGVGARVVEGGAGEKGGGGGLSVDSRRLLPWPATAAQSSSSLLLIRVKLNGGLSMSVVWRKAQRKTSTNKQTKKQ